MQIGGQFIIDASVEEEACVQASVAVFVDHSGRICGSRKEGDGCIPLQQLGWMAECTAAMGKGIFDILDKAVKKAWSTGGSCGTGVMDAAGAGFL